MIWPGGSKYVGSWIDGYKHGEGTIIVTELGFKYEGNWVSDELQGHGVITFDDGVKYVGNFR